MTLKERYERVVRDLIKLYMDATDAIIYMKVDGYEIADRYETLEYDDAGEMVKDILYSLIELEKDGGLDE